MINEFRRCKECPVKVYLDMAEGCTEIELFVKWFESVCRRCKERQMGKGLRDNDDAINVIGNFTSVLADKNGGVYDEGDKEVLQTGSGLLREKDEPQTRDLERGVE